MSKEAEEFFRQKTIENAKRPRMKKFLALVNREAEGKIMQEYADQQLGLYDVNQKRGLLKKWWKYFDEESVAINCNDEEREEVINDFFNCG